MRFLTLNWIIVAGFSLLLCSACTEGASEEIAEEEEIELKLDTTGAGLLAIEHLHEKINLKNKDKSLVEYANSDPNRPTGDQRVIYIMPLGYMSTEVEDALRMEEKYLEIFFQLEVEIMNRIPFDDLTNEQVVTRSRSEYIYGGKYDKEEIPVNVSEQIETNSLLDHYVVPNMPEDAVAVLAVTDHDIYSPKYNFLFGSSRSAKHAGVISTHRLREDPRHEKYNIRKVMSKQIANLFSISNVKDYVCLMKFANSVYELQEKPMYLSPRVLEKLKVSIGFDHDKRFMQLRNFWFEEGNVEMTDYYDACLESIGAIFEIEEQ